MNSTLEQTNPEIFRILSRSNERLRIRKLRVQKFHSIFKYQGFLELRNPRSQRWVLVLQDASESGKYRHQTFDPSGFTGHSTFDSLLEAITDAVGLGYKRLSNGSLDLLSSTNQWLKGTEVTELCSRFNRGEINLAQFNELTSLVNARYSTL